jgi:hypothetical protein
MHVTSELKVKLHHTRKAYAGVVSFTNQPLYSWGKEPQKSTNSIRAWTDILQSWRREKSLSLPGIKPWFLRHPAHSLVTATTYTEY